MPKYRFKWTLEIEVAEIWVADGFDMTDERAHRMLAEHLSRAYGYELKAKVLTRPLNGPIAKAQGYKTVKAYLAARRK